jgi:AraC-like DNA-binding protein
VKRRDNFQLDKKIVKQGQKIMIYVVMTKAACVFVNIFIKFASLIKFMILIISISVILLCLFLLYNNFSKNKNSIYLCGSLIFMCITSILHHFTIISPNRFWIAILVGHSIPIAFLTGPFLYFYTRNTLRISIRFSRWDYLHFLPFTISLISIFPYYFKEFDLKLRIAQLLVDDPNNALNVNFSWLYPSKINLLVRPVFLFVYALWSLILAYRFYNKRRDFPIKNEERIAVKWLMVINSILVLMCIGYTIFTIYFYTLPKIESREQINSSLLSYILTIMFALIPILIVVFPEILYGMHKFKTSSKSKIVIQKDNHESLVSTSALILDFVKKEENLQNPDFSIADICKALTIKHEDVNYCFNTVLNIKFITLKKELRVDLAKKELISGKLLSHSMEGIWTKCGFSSKTNFFVAFKEVTGLTPLEFSKETGQNEEK